MSVFQIHHIIMHKSEILGAQLCRIDASAEIQLDASHNYSGVPYEFGLDPVCAFTRTVHSLW